METAESTPYLINLIMLLCMHRTRHCELKVFDYESFLVRAVSIFDFYGESDLRTLRNNCQTEILTYRLLVISAQHAVSLFVHDTRS